MASRTGITAENVLAAGPRVPLSRGTLFLLGLLLLAVVGMLVSVPLFVVFGLGSAAIALDVLNILGREDNDIENFYTSRLPGEPLAGVDDVHLHPAEPRTFRVSLTKRF